MQDVPYDDRPTIYLSSETKTYCHPGFNTISLCHNLIGETWSRCTKHALSCIPTDIVLYFQEDYFLTGSFPAARINRYASYMLNEEPDVHHIDLTSFGNMPPYLLYSDEFWEVLTGSRYRVNCQVGLWRTNSLHNLLHDHENAWMFEIFGTIRSRQLQGIFLTLPVRNRACLYEPCISYIHTGIIKGKWNPLVVSLIQRYDPNLDLSIRGIYLAKPYLFNKIETLLSTLSSPYSFLLSLLSLCRLRTKHGSINTSFANDNYRIKR